MVLNELNYENRQQIYNCLIIQIQPFRLYTISENKDWSELSDTAEIKISDSDEN